MATVRRHYPRRRLVVGCAALLAAFAFALLLPQPANAQTPTVSSVSVSDITNTGATVTITVANAGTSPIIVRARVFIGDTMEYFPLVESTTTGTAEFTLNTLPGGTTYHIEASLDSSFETGVIRESFTTLPADYTITGVTIGSRTHTSAVATITSTGLGVINKYVTLRIRPVGTTIWDGLVSINFSPLSVDVDLEDLTSGTEYELHVSTDESYLGGQNLYVRFTTLKVRVSEIAVSGNIHQTSLGLDVTILDPDGLKQYIFLRYRATPSGSWTYFRSHSSTDQGDGVLFGLTSAYGLRGGGVNRLQLPCGRNGLNDLHHPSPLTSTGSPWTTSTQTSATVTVAIGAPNGQSQTVYVQYREQGTQAWTDAANVVTRGAEGTTSLTGLTSGTVYDIQASLDDTFPAGETESAQFTTLPPIVSDVEVDNVTQTTAEVTVTITEPNGQPQVINVVYGGRIYNSPATDRTVTSSSSSDTATITLTGLLPDIPYHVRARVLDDRFITPRSVVANFDTDPPDPSLVSISVRTVTGTYTEIWMAVANRNSGTRMHSRYRETPDGPWSTTTSSNAGRSTFVRHLNSLNANTEYKAQLSLEPSFPEAETLSTTFKSLLANPSLDHLNVIEADITQTEASVIVTIDDPSGTETVFMRRRELPFGPWGNIQTETTTTSTVDFTLSSLTTGGQYQIQASQDTAFPDNDTLSELFTTAPPDPAISEVFIENRQGLSLSVGVRISNVRSRLPVYLRYRTTPSGPWSAVVEEDARTPDAFLDVAFDVRSLTPATEYEFEVSLDSSFPPAETISEMDTTSPTSVSSVEVQKRLEDAATLSATLLWADGQEREVYTRYREVGANEWTEVPSVATTTNNAVIELTGLFGGTDYEAQVSTDSAFPIGAGSATFTTLPPRITDVGIYSYAQTQVWVRIGLAGVSSDNVIQMNSRYRRTSPLGPWIHLIPSPPPPPTPGPAQSLVAPLDGLEQETGYEYAESLDIHFAANATKSVRFSTIGPSISDVTVDVVAQTEATVTARIHAADGSSRRVYTRYRSAGAVSWFNGPTASSRLSFATLTLTGLISDNNYEVQVSTYRDFLVGATSAATFKTLPPSIDNLRMSEINQTDVVPVVDIVAYNERLFPVFFRYKTLPSGAWGPIRQSTATPIRATTPMSNPRLTDLTSDTEYELQASSHWSFPADKTLSTTFTTLPPDLVEVSVDVDSVTQTGADFTVAVHAPNGRLQTVYLRYRERGANEWTDQRDVFTTTDSASDTLSGLTSGTSHELRASLDDTFPSGATKTVSFTTLSPSASIVTVDNIAQTTVEITVTIKAPNGRPQTVYVRTYDTKAEGRRSERRIATSTTTATVTLSGLTPGIDYLVDAIVQPASHLFPPVFESYRTLPLDPSLSDVAVEAITMSQADVVVAIENRDGRSPTVHFRHRAAGATNWQPATSRVAAADEVTFPLSSLDNSTRYQVQVSLDNTFPAGETLSGDFTTLQANPSLSGVSVAGIIQDGATATVTIADPSGTETVHLRYRQSPSGRWSARQTDTSTTSTVEFTLQGLRPETKYEIQASQNTSFPATDTRAQRFTTLPPAPRILAIEIGIDDSTDTHTAVVSLEHVRDAQSVYVRYRTSDTDPWSAPDQETTSGNDVDVDLSGMQSDTKYEIQGSLDSNFATATTPITVTTPPPFVGSVTVVSREQETATLVAAIRFSNGRSYAVHVRYREVGASRWTSGPALESDTANADIELTDLSAGAEYEVEASIGAGFPPTRTGTATFSTQPPTITGTHLSLVLTGSASVWVSIAARHSDTPIVYSRYRGPSTPWIHLDPEPTRETGHIAPLFMPKLDADTQYEMQVSLDGGFPSGAIHSISFRTADQSQRVQVVTAEGKSQTTAFAVASTSRTDGASRTLYMRYRESPDGDWSETQPAMTETRVVTYELSDLAPGTLYEMQVSLSASFPGGDTLSAVFVTTRSATSTTTTTSTGGGGGGGGFGPAPVAPKFADGFRATREVAENARPGDAVGVPVPATHPDDLEITYSLSGTDAASFTVDEETGQIQVKEGVELELGQTLTLNLTATDSAGFGAIIIVAIEVVEAMHHRYDANRNGNIERDEVIAAVKDYFDGEIDKDEVIDLIKLYFAESG